MIVHTYTYTQIFTAFLEKTPPTLVLTTYLFLFFLFFLVFKFFKPATLNTNVYCTTPHQPYIPPKKQQVF